jgi:hypothetical protein
LLLLLLLPPLRLLVPVVLLPSLRRPLAERWPARGEEVGIDVVPEAGLGLEAEVTYVKKGS